eukprot:c43344_g1_i1.p1 GENE.c43344_g1_i1~~c43344_g1_i1.p1  ORF type:complete len:158 (+),score=11.31 c43344_g1_i1:66-539(+)
MMASQAPTPIKHIVAAVNFSVSSLVAFEHSLALARGLQAQLHVVYIVEATNDLSITESMKHHWDNLVKEGKVKVDGLKERALTTGVSCSSQVCKGLVEDVLIALSSQSDIIFLGMSPKNSMESVIFGNVTISALRLIQRPLMVIRTTCEDMSDEMKK